MYMKKEGGRVFHRARYLSLLCLGPAVLRDPLRTELTAAGALRSKLESGRGGEARLRASSVESSEAARA